jgi:hypothetical protein
MGKCRDGKCAQGLSFDHGILWQEGHTAHATREEAIAEALSIHDIYADFAESYMAMPVVKGVKTINERLQAQKIRIRLKPLCRMVVPPGRYFLSRQTCKGF